MSNEPLGIYEELRAKAKQFEDREVERKRMLQMATYVATPAPPARPVVRPPAPVKFRVQRDGGYYRRNPEHRRRRAPHAEGRLGITRAQVIEAVCEESGLSWDELLNDRRMRRLAWPRHIAMYMIDLYCPDYSLTEIARWFHRDHTSVMHGIWKTGELLAYGDPATTVMVANVHQRLAAMALGN